ncbi:MAG: arginine deiminase-related protein, partial [Planctomycetota bacterium]|nr:arginine deiminase-related protein [Planctomycetota bacterium]
MPIARQAGEWGQSLQALAQVPLLNRVLLGNPKYFEVTEVINVHMADSKGNPKSIDSGLALKQWGALSHAYKKLNIQVEILDPVEGLSDFCFTANPSLVLPLPNGTREVWLSKMAHSSRRSEVDFHARFFEGQKIPTRRFPDCVTRFEGCGDGILHPGRHLIHAGTGTRSSIEAWNIIAEAHPELQILHYELQDSRFYHLDTALAPLNETTALFVPCAFNDHGITLLQSAFEDLIPISLDEALNFAGNAHCPDGKNVLLQSGNPQVEAVLSSKGFQAIPLDTSEF